MKTPAAILIEQNKPLVVDEVEIPALGYGQVLVDISVSRICGSQLGEIDGVKGPDKWLPHLLGHEGGGTVVDVGPEVRHVKPGDRVVLHWREGAGIESRPTTYKWGNRTVNAGYLTTFNKYGVISENRLTKVPSNTDYEVCALLADTLTSGIGVMPNEARVRVGESVVIIGCGGIGLGAVLGASLAGAYPVIAVDIRDHKLQKAKEYGATHLVNSSNTDFAKAVRAMLGGNPDVVVDGTGNPTVLESAFALTSQNGRCIIFGVMRHDKRTTWNTLPLHFGKVLSGSDSAGHRPRRD